MALQFNTLFSIRGAVLLEFPIFKFSTGTLPSKVALHLLPLDESSQPKCSYGTGAEQVFTGVPVGLFFRVRFQRDRARQI